MDILKSLVHLKELKMLKKHQGCLHLSYDKQFDCLQIILTPLDTETAVYYVDKNVALIYDVETKVIVGLQVEDFEKVFLPAHGSVNRAWRLSSVVDTKELKDFGEIALVFEERKPVIAREVIRASSPVLGANARKFEELVFA